MNTFIRHAVCLPAEGSNPQFSHTFGGTLEQPAIPPGCAAPCHLLYTIDTEDSLFPIRVPGTRFLPLIYCQQYNAAAMSYRVENDKITIDWIEDTDWDEDFPYDNYPGSFPQKPITLHQADLTAIETAESLDEEQDTPNTQFGGWHYLCQGIPEVKCRNPHCGTGSMDVFGVIYNAPVPGVRLWNPDDDWDDVQIIYQICSDCSSIQVCNRCG